MANRTTPTLVEGIIEVDAAIDLDPFITIANQLVTELCTDSGYTAVRLELIERWLSAHFYTNRDMRAFQEKAGPVSETMQSRVDLGFDTSHYGQTAMRMDTDGNLAKLNEDIKKGKSPSVSVLWLGTEEETVE